MASRAETAQRRADLREHVREGLRNGSYRPGESLPSLPELARRYELSRETARTVLHELVAEGILTSAPREGLFVNAYGVKDPDACFLMVVEQKSAESPANRNQTVLDGFERRITARGGVSLCWQAPDAPRPQAPIAGVFLYGCLNPVTIASIPRGVPMVSFGSAVSGLRTDDGPAQIDQVGFDNVSGGRDATLHLLDHGYRAIGFLGRHPIAGARSARWSQEREQGWKGAMRRRLPDARLMSFHPRPGQEALVGHLKYLADLVAEEFIPHRARVDALVAVDDWAIEGLLRVWRKRGLPSDELPAMVGFEDLPEARNPYVTSLKLPHDRLGEYAADLLWQRTTGQITGPPVMRKVSMDIATRLSSHRRRRSDTLASVLAESW